MEKPDNELDRLIKAFRYSCDGLKAAWRGRAFRLEILLAIMLLPVALVEGATTSQRAILVGTIMLVLITELLNSAIETAIDRISLDRHDLSKRAKDLGSAAVLVSLINAGVIWLIILGG